MEEYMSFRIVYGRAGTGKSEYCYKEIAQKIKKQRFQTETLLKR